MLPRIGKLTLRVSGIKATVASEGIKHKGDQIHTYVPCNHPSVMAGYGDLVGQFEYEAV